MDPAQTNETLVWVVRATGALHFVALVLACLTPIPPHWERNLAQLPDVHRRFAVAQNIFIGGVIAVAGLICLVFARELVDGSRLARGVCAVIALWWGARLIVLPYLKATPHLSTPLLKLGFVLLCLQCAATAIGFSWLALR